MIEEKTMKADLKYAEAMTYAVQCWFTDKTKNIEMDNRLAEAFANKLVEVVNDRT